MTSTLQKFDKNAIFEIVIKVGQEITPEFHLNEHDKELYYRLFLYFFNFQEFEKFSQAFNLKKGLLVIGGIGVGKTILFKVFREIIKQYTRYYDFAIVSPIDICGKYSLDGHEIILSNTTNCFKETNRYKDKSQPRSRLYDDLGSEETWTSFYGTKVNVMEKIILTRYDLFIDKGMKTYFTTNLQPKEIAEKYGERAISRLREMTNVIIYPGIDRRK